MAKRVKRALKKVTRGLKRQRSRRKKMHPARRKQESLGIVSTLASAGLIFTGGTLAIILACVMGVVAVFAVMFSRASPPPTAKQHKPEPRRGVKTDKRVPHGTFKMKPGQNLGVAAGRKPCGARCQYSKKARSTCNCSCLGAQHGVKR